MRTKYTVALSVLGGIAIGAIAMQGLHAQQGKSAVVVVDISDVTDAAAWKTITQRPTADTSTVKQGGRYITRTDNITALDGTPPKRFVVIAFDSVGRAKDWYNSPDQQKVNEVRAKATKSRTFIVEGM